MKKYINQPIISTLADLQGEIKSKELLEKILKKLPSRFPIGSDHDAEKESIGYMDNIRIESIPEKTDEWYILADVYLKDDKNIDDAIHGLSFSWNEVERRVSGIENGCIYLSYPLYNNSALKDLLFDELTGTSIGKWYKKELTPTTVGLIVSLVCLIIGPEWSKQYDEKIRPWIVKTIKKIKENSSTNNLDFDGGMVIEHASHGRVHLHFVGFNPKNDLSLDQEKIKMGISKCINYLDNNIHAKNKRVNLIRLFFDDHDMQYKICYTLFEDGHDMNYANNELERNSE